MYHAVYDSTPGCGSLGVALVCNDGDISLRCESPNTNLFLIDFKQQNKINCQQNFEQLRQWGNDCYHVDDSLSAIEFYDIGLQQLNNEESIFQKQSSM